MKQQLIDCASSGDEVAQEALFRQHYPRTLRLAWGLLGDEQDAEETAQDTLVYALTHLQRYDPDRGAFSTWLYTITVSRCRSKRRRKWLPTIQLATWLERRNGDGGIDPAPGPEEHLEQKERDAVLWNAVAQLSPKQREAVVLRYAIGLSYTQMAEAMQCSASAAQSRTWLGEQKLRELLSSSTPEAMANAKAQDRTEWEKAK